MKILVCGDAMSDEYWHGNVSRISPEGPVPIVSITRTEKREGAAANVANNIEAMGVSCERMFGSSKDRISKIRLLAQGQHVARVDFDYPQYAIECDVSYEEALKRCEIVVFSDYGKGALANISALIAKALQMGRRVLVDPKGHDYGKYRGVTMIKPNQDEMRELVGGWVSQDELDFKARQFLLVSGIESILLTQAAQGMTFYTRSSTLHVQSEANQREIVDVSGAGETALAAYAAALALGYEPAVKYANKAAGIACGRFGTTLVTHEEVFGTG